MWNNLWWALVAGSLPLFFTVVEGFTDQNPNRTRGVIGFMEFTQSGISAKQWDLLLFVNPFFFKQFHQ
jgi:hypothetical protein